MPGSAEAVLAASLSARLWDWGTAELFYLFLSPPCSFIRAVPGAGRMSLHLSFLLLLQVWGVQLVSVGHGFECFCTFCPPTCVGNSSVSFGVKS